MAQKGGGGGKKKKRGKKKKKRGGGGGPMSGEQESERGVGVRGGGGRLMSPTQRGAQEPGEKQRKKTSARVEHKPDKPDLWGAHEGR